MKYKLLLGLSCLILVFSCKKGHNSPPTYPVKFAVSGFTQTQIPIGNDANGLQTEALKTISTDTIPVDLLYFQVYRINTSGNPSGSPAFAKTVQKTNDSFGTFETSLPAGDYAAVFCAGTNDLLYGIGDITTSDSFSYEKEWKDVFYKAERFTVGTSGVSKSVQISRIAAQLELNITDAIPANVKSIQLTLTDAANLVPTTGLPSTTRKNIVINQTFATGDIGKNNYKIDFFTLNNSGAPFTFTIKYYTTDTDPVTKVVQNVTCSPNKRTILSGNLFTPGNSSFDVTIDPGYNPPTTIDL